MSTITFSPYLLKSVRRVWEAIAFDVVWFPDEPSNEMAVEAALGARDGHPDLFGRPSSAELEGLILTHGYEPVLRALAAHPDCQLPLI